MPEEYRETLIRLLRVHADTEASVIFPETDWIRDHIAFAPTPQDRVIEAAIYADEQRHGLLFYNLLRELGIEVTAEYFRGRRSLGFANLGVACWADVVLLHFLTEKAGMLQLRDLIGCSYGPLRRVARRLTREEARHTNIGYRHLRRLCRTEAGRAAAEALLPKWYPASLDMFGSSSSRWMSRYIGWGLKRTPYEELRAEFIRDVDPKLERLGLAPPDPRLNRTIL
jgi:ring-1,2-phenylacetyl-CoA epoxidase subunit PaaA